MLDVSLEIRATLEPMSNDPSAFTTQYDVEVRIDSDTTDTVSIGNARAYVFDLAGAIDAGVPLLDVFDEEGEHNHYIALLGDDEGEYSEAATQLLNMEIEETWVGKLLVLDVLEIQPEHRGRGYGLQAICLILRHLGSGCTIAAMRPHPLQFREDRDPRDH